MTSYLSQKIKRVSFLSIIMVVVLHCYNLDNKQNGIILHFGKDYNWVIQNFFSYGITRVAVPMFFIISGYLFFLGFTNQKGVLVEKIKKRIKTIVIPYFFWTIFGVLLYFIMQSIPRLLPFFNKKLVINYTFSDWFNAVFVELVPYQLWFLRDLIVMVLLSWLIFFLIKKFKFLLPVVSFWSWFFNQNTVFLSSESILFFSLGASIALYYPEFLEKTSTKKYLFFLSWMGLVTFKIALLYFFKEEKTIINLTHKTSIILGLLAFWYIYDTLYPKTKRFFLKWDKIFEYSFFIYVFHEPLLTIIKKTLFLFLGKKVLSYFIIYCLSPFITISICLITGFVLKKYFKKGYEFSTGNR